MFMAMGRNENTKTNHVKSFSGHQQNRTSERLSEREKTQLFLRSSSLLFWFCMFQTATTTTPQQKQPKQSIFIVIHFELLEIKSSFLRQRMKDKKERKKQEELSRSVMKCLHVCVCESLLTQHDGTINFMLILSFFLQAVRLMASKSHESLSIV